MNYQTQMVSCWRRAPAWLRQHVLYNTTLCHMTLTHVDIGQIADNVMSYTT